MDAKTLKHRRTRRTTLTLEPDVADYVEHRLAANRKLKEKVLINDLLRKGIRTEESRARPAFAITPFKTEFVEGMTRKRLEELLDEF